MCMSRTAPASACSGQPTKHVQRMHENTSNLKVVENIFVFPQIHNFLFLSTIMKSFQKRSTLEGKILINVVLLMCDKSPMH